MKGWCDVETELSLQERAFKVYVELEMEELKNFCLEVSCTSEMNSREASIRLLLELKAYVHKRVDVIKEASGLLTALEAARSKEKVTA